MEGGAAVFVRQPRAVEGERKGVFVHAKQGIEQVVVTRGEEGPVEQAGVLKPVVAAPGTEVGIDTGLGTGAGIVEGGIDGE